MTKNANKKILNEITQNGAETGQMSKKPENFKKFEVRKLKYVEIGDELTDVKFVMGIFGRISEYWYYIDTNFRRYFPSLGSNNQFCIEEIEWYLYHDTRIIAWNDS